MQINTMQYLNPLRLVAIGMVVMLHVAAPVRDQLENMAFLNWFIGSLFDVLGRAGVPLFVMISGALLLGKEEPISVFYKKRMSKILIPLLTWGLLYYFYWQLTIDKTIDPAMALVTLLKGPTFYHLWYLYMLIGLYLITPFLRIMLQHITKKQLEILLILWLVFAILLPHIYEELTILFHLDFKLGIEMPFLNTYLGYFILGHYLHHFSVPKKINFSLSIYCFIAITILIAIGNYLIYRKTGEYNPLFILNQSPLVLLQATFIFTAFKAKNVKNSTQLTKLGLQISTLSFGIYLIHPLIIDILDKGYLGLKLNAHSTNTILSIPSTYVVVFIISFLLSLLISKIPLLKKTIGS